MTRTKQEQHNFEQARVRYQKALGNAKAIVPTSREQPLRPPRDVYIPAPSRHGRDWDDDV